MAVQKLGVRVHVRGQKVDKSTVVGLLGCGREPRVIDLNDVVTLAWVHIGPILNESVVVVFHVI